MTLSDSYINSINLLLKASTKLGFVAAVQEHDNYKRIWTRDGTVCSIAALLSGNQQLIATAKATINTIFSHQHLVGYMPSNVTPGNSIPSYGGLVGRADNPSWAVIGLCHYTLSTGDTTLAEKYQNEVQKCFNLLDAWEFNGRNLIYVPQSGDWADEYIQHGYILFEQLLRLWALQLSYKVYNNSSWANKANSIKTTIQHNYWLGNISDKPYMNSLIRWQNETKSQYWLMGFNPANVYKYFDLQANALALLLNIGNKSQNDVLIQWLSDKLANNDGKMLPSFFPTITDADDDMKELKQNFAYTFRNIPHQFHNGGLWPVWNGWMAAALASAGEKNIANHLLQAINVANRLDSSSFNECFDGRNNQPCGVPQCSWSAAGAIIAEQVLRGNCLITSI